MSEKTSLFMCNMYDVYLFNMLLVSVYPDIGNVDGKQSVVNKVFL